MGEYGRRNVAYDEDNGADPAGRQGHADLDPATLNKHLYMSIGDDLSQGNHRLLDQ